MLLQKFKKLVQPTKKSLQKTFLQSGSKDLPKIYKYWWEKCSPPIIIISPSEEDYEE